MSSAVKSAKNLTPLSGVRILIADDDPINQEIASRMLKKFGCAAEVACDGDVAVKRFANEKFDLILMDCEMPMMDGPDATRRIRDLEATATRVDGRAPRIPIMASTARAWCDVRERCVSAGMDDFIVKPFDARQMGETLKRWLHPQGEEAVGLAQNDDSPGVPPNSSAAAIDPAAITEIRKLGGAGGDALVARVVSQFLGSANQSAATIRQCLESGDGQGGWRAAHTFKSSTGTLGARRLYTCCGEIERLARDEGAAAALPLLGTLDAELAAALIELGPLGPP
jgi:CheY-like chemotaxis protein/HPt (histidine-containing phosphotransfer) domain-containing protein